MKTEVYYHVLWPLWSPVHKRLFKKIYFKLVILVFSIDAPKHSFLKWDLFFGWNFMWDFSSIVTIRADFQQGMESVSQFKKNTVTEIYWLIYAAAMVIFSVNELI